MLYVIIEENNYLRSIYIGMALSTIASIASYKSFGPNEPTWGPYSILFPTDLLGTTSVSDNIIDYADGAGANIYRNGIYRISAQCSHPTSLPWRMFDNSTVTRWFSGLQNTSNITLNGVSTVAYDRPCYDWTTGNYVGGRADGAATWNTNGYQGEYFQIEYPFNFLLTKIYLRTSGGNEFARAPKILYIFGSSTGSSWTLVDTITTSVTTNVEYSFNVSNTTKYKYYRFLANKVTGGNNTGNNFSLVSFKTEGTAWSLQLE
jgi:hypothetical protein